MTAKLNDVVMQDTRDFWEKKCFKHITDFEYGRYTLEEFVKNMQRMGWDSETIHELVEDHVEE
jgi:hypothetical protein